MPQAHRLDFVGEHHLTALSFEFHYKWNTPFVDDAVVDIFTPSMVGRDDDIRFVP